MGQNVAIGEDGLTEQDRNPAQWLESEVTCYSCGDSINYGDECVALRLVYPAPHTGRVMLLDAVEEDGRPTAEPILFCYHCWDMHTEDLKHELSQLFLQRRRVVSHPKSCSFCHEPIGWGDYVGHAVHGELDVSPRTHEVAFKPGTNETVETAELVCMECLAWMNDDLDENIWLHLWMPDGTEGAPDGGQEGAQGL